MAITQAFLWQTLAPNGTFSTNLVGEPRADAPQLISNLVCLVMKQERLDDSGLVTLAAWTTCDFSLRTRTAGLVLNDSSSSSDDSESDDSEDEELSSIGALYDWTCGISDCRGLLGSVGALGSELIPRWR